MVTIEKLIVKIGKKELNLTLEEAKELQSELNKTLGNVIPVFVPSIQIYPKYVAPNSFEPYCGTICSTMGLQAFTGYKG